MVRVVVLAGAVLAAGVSPAAAGSDAGGAPFTVLALQRADVGRGGRVNGSVGVVDGRLRLDRNVVVAGMAAAPHVVLRPRTSVEALRCNVVTGGTARCEPMPAIDPAIFERPEADAGAEAVRVPAKSRHSALAPGAYGSLKVGKGSEMLLAGGDYTFRSIRLDARVTFQCLAPCTVSVARGVKIGRAAIVFGDGVQLRVAGRKGTRVKVASEATFDGVVYAPTAHVKLAGKVNLRGTVLGKVVRVGSQSRIGPVDPQSTAE